jgi:hypothetical protein
VVSARENSALDERDESTYAYDHTGHKLGSWGTNRVRRDGRPWNTSISRFLDERILAVGNEAIAHALDELERDESVAARVAAPCSDPDTTRA